MAAKYNTDKFQKRVAALFGLVHSCELQSSSLGTIIELGTVDTIKCAIRLERTAALFPMIGTQWNVDYWPTAELDNFFVLADMLVSTESHSHTQ